MLTRKWMATAIAVCCLGMGLGFASAQESQISISAASSNRLQADLKTLVELSDPNLRKQWQTLKDVLDSFVQGAELDTPARMDIHFGAKELAYVATIPVADLEGRNGFIANIKAFGFKVVGPNAEGLFEITPQRAVARGPRAPRNPAPSTPAKTYYMRAFKDYVVFAPEPKLVPKQLADPALTKAMLPGATDIAAEMQNDAASMDAKRKNFQELRKQLEAAVEFRRGESEADFELRKLSLEQNLAEAERFLIESKLLRMRWTTDEGQATAAGDLLMTALEGTSLAESIALLVQQPSLFANVKFGADPALHLRVNMAIDPMRTAHAADLYRVMLPSLQSAMDSRPNLNAEGKATAKEALSKLFGMLTDALPMKQLDAIIDVHADGSGKQVGLTAIRTADGTKATEILAMFPKIRAGWKFTPAVAEHQGVTIHSLGVAPHRKEEFSAVFGGESVVYIGVAKDVVWGAAGDKSLDRLKQAIDEAATPAPSEIAPEFLDFTMRFDPWVRVLDAMRAKEPPSKTTDKAEIEALQQRDKARKYALETLGNGDDVLSGTMSREGDEVRGELQVKTGLLRFIGTMIADFTNENLR